MNINNILNILIKFGSHCGNILRFCTKYISYRLQLKSRNLYTRRNQLRLRYVVLAMLFLMTGISGFMMGGGNSDIQTSLSLSVAEIEPAAGGSDLGVNILDQMEAGPRAELSLTSMMAPDVPESLPLDREVTIESGDALSSVMEKQGVGNTDTQKIIKAMKPHFDPRRIKIGQKIAISFDEADEDQQNFREMKIKLDTLKTLVVAREGEGFNSRIDEKKVEKKIKAKQAEIEISLSGSAAKAGIPSAVVSEAIRIFSWNVDFQRDIRSKDSLEVLYESYETAEGNVAKNGNILYAKLTLSGREIPLYRYKMSNGRVDYFGPDGISIKRTLMKTPINGARMSSGYGRRRHPVLGYTKMHKGVDFAARTGTPIFAAGDGVIEKAGWFSSYGKYVRIRHNSKLKTAYAHMSNINSKLRSGTRVTQGQVIGYVGTTGRSTGPHLHYEVLKNGVQVNPRSVNLPTGEELSGKEKAEFKTVVSTMRRQYAAALEGTKLASFASRLFN
jgi:murein DD-endopeptidase MepM/ murein hydrolase activator NlpD